MKSSFRRQLVSISILVVLAWIGHSAKGQQISCADAYRESLRRENEFHFKAPSQIKQAAPTEYLSRALRDEDDRHYKALAQIRIVYNECVESEDKRRLEEQRRNYEADQAARKARAVQEDSTRRTRAAQVDAAYKAKAAEEDVAKQPNIDPAPPTAEIQVATKRAARDGLARITSDAADEMAQQGLGLLEDSARGLAANQINDEAANVLKGIRTTVPGQTYGEMAIGHFIDTKPLANPAAQLIEKIGEQSLNYIQSPNAGAASPRTHAGFEGRRFAVPTTFGTHYSDYLSYSISGADMQPQHIPRDMFDNKTRTQAGRPPLLLRESYDAEKRSTNLTPTPALPRDLFSQ
jgi:hypothetical protein